MSAITEPTNRQINEAIAEICGYPVQEYSGRSTYPCVTRMPEEIAPDRDSQRLIMWRLPETDGVTYDPCTDRNLLPEIMAVFGPHDYYAMQTFAEIIDPENGMYDGMYLYDESDVIALIAKDPREICIAALKACGKWGALCRTE